MIVKGVICMMRLEGGWIIINGCLMVLKMFTVLAQMNEYVI